MFEHLAAVELKKLEPLALGELVPRDVN